jgi:hypothetical protein
MVAKDEFDQIINETKIMLQRNDDRKDRKRPQTLDLHLNQQLLANEKKHYLKEYNQTLTSIRIVHKVSTINETLSRSDSSYYSAWTYCSFVNGCPVKYRFNVKNKPMDNAEYIQIMTTIMGLHKHDTDKQIQISFNHNRIKEITAGIVHNA